jgi:hypothetical protein
VIATLQKPQGSPATLDSLQSRFLALMPRIECHARIYFRHVSCPDLRADKIAETLALAWKWFVRLQERSKDAERFPMAFTFLVARAVKSGRRLCGRESAKEVLSSTAQQRHGFRVESLPISIRRPASELYGTVRGQEALDAYEERLQDNHITPPPDAAAFRIDFPQFVGALPERDRELAMFLSLGHSAKKAGHRFRLSPGRVTQLRYRWFRHWRTFHGEDATGSGDERVQSAS